MEIIYFIGRGLIVVSIILLAVGLVINIVQNNSKDRRWITNYLASLLFLEGVVLYVGAYLERNTLFLFSVSFFIHFVWLAYFYNREVFEFPYSFYITLITIGFLLLLLHLTTNNNLTWLQPYARIPYSLIITLYSLGYFYALVRGKIATNYPRDLLNTAILLFFGIDTFLATGTPYLIKREYLQIVAWFWFFRALLLQSFYIALIYFGWKSSQNTGPSS